MYLSQSFPFSPNSWYWSLNTRSFLGFKVTHQSQSSVRRRWSATCVLIPLWSLRCLHWLRCALNSSAVFLPLFTTVPCVSRHKNTRMTNPFKLSTVLNDKHFLSCIPFIHIFCIQPVSVTLRAPSAVSVTWWEVSAVVNPTWLAGAVTSVPRGPTASVWAAALVSLPTDQLSLSDSSVYKTVISHSNLQHNKSIYSVVDWTWNCIDFKFYKMQMCF